MDIQVILPANRIPTGSKVSKPNGGFEYTLLDMLKIYAEKESGIAPVIVKSENDCRFIVRGDHMNAVAGDRELIWHTDTRTLIDYLEADEDD